MARLPAVRAQEEDVASPGHKLGQVIGVLFEEHLRPRLQALVEGLGPRYYLDAKGPRPARPGLAITWVDDAGSAHDLDYVIEKDGAPGRKGVPVAFVELAWRRYTKHSVNKAGELIGTLPPLKRTHRGSCRFVGAIVSGEWTGTALDRMRGEGITVAHFGFDVIRQAFLKHGGVDIDYPQKAGQEEKQAILSKLDALTPGQTKAIGDAIFAAENKELAEFLALLKASIESKVAEVAVAQAFSARKSFANPSDAMNHLLSVEVDREQAEFEAFNIEIRWANGDMVSGRFADRQKAHDFLTTWI